MNKSRLAAIFLAKITQSHQISFIEEPMKPSFRRVIVSMTLAILGLTLFNLTACTHKLPPDANELCSGLGGISH
ncbi:hypothetical protein [Coxiella-like endosymbiont]|uniref:hypothetical protein n=1 Tax=Coxiella-like endosymbiont TaxID=1592897 RepID=UPI00272A0420|nr:hypothetical protein [Coxiella-like endosymbiont]